MEDFENSIYSHDILLAIPPFFDLHSLIPPSSSLIPLFFIYRLQSFFLYHQTFHFFLTPSPCVNTLTNTVDSIPPAVKANARIEVITIK